MKSWENYATSFDAGLITKGHMFALMFRSLSVILKQGCIDKAIWFKMANDISRNIVEIWFIWTPSGSNICTYKPNNRPGDIWFIY